MLPLSCQRPLRRTHTNVPRRLVSVRLPLKLPRSVERFCTTAMSPYTRTVISRSLSMTFTFVLPDAKLARRAARVRLTPRERAAAVGGTSLEKCAGIRR